MSVRKRLRRGIANNVRSSVGGARRRLRVEPYRRNAIDADGDGIIQEGTAWERPAGTRLLTNAGRDIPDGSILNERPAGIRVIDARGKNVDYTPTYSQPDLPEQDGTLKPGILGAKLSDSVGTLGTRTTRLNDISPSLKDRNTPATPLSGREQRLEAARQRRLARMGVDTDNDGQSASAQNRSGFAANRARLASTVWGDYTPKPIDARLARLSTAGDDDALASPAVMWPKDGKDLATRADALRHLRNGGSVSDVANELWHDVLNDPMISSDSTTDTGTMFYRVTPEIGAIGDTTLFFLRGEDGKPTNQGFVLKASPDVQDGIGEVIGGNIMESLGITTTGATYDGLAEFDPDKFSDTPVFNFGSDNSQRVQYIITPLAFQDANVDALKDLSLPRKGTMYSPALLKKTQDEGNVEAFGAFLANYIAGVSDRNPGNVMTYRDGDKAVVTPIDLALALEYSGGPSFHNPHTYLVNYVVDPDLFQRARSYYAKQQKLNKDRAEKYRQKIRATVDEMLERAERIAAREPEDIISDQLELLKSLGWDGPAMEKAEDTLRRGLQDFREVVEQLDRNRDWIVDMFTEGGRTIGDWLGIARDKQTPEQLQDPFDR